jgi:methionyl aminopeptidase
MIYIKDQAAISKMSMAGLELAGIFEDLALQVIPGVSTGAIDVYIADQLKKRNLVSMTKGYMGYKHVSCISLNNEIVHGVPSFSRTIQDNDLVKVDICASLQGYAADMARVFCMPALLKNSKILHFVQIAQQALDAGIAVARVGNRLSDISASIQCMVESAGYGVVRDFAGHGIGKRMHEDPEVLNYGKPGKGPLLQSGMALAIEPMITMGSYDLFVDSDGWTAKTVDHSWAMHIEDTIVITNGEPLILTRKVH